MKYYDDYVIIYSYNDETVGRHHWLNGHEFEQTPGDGEGQGREAWHTCSSWDWKESDTTERLKNNNSYKDFCNQTPVFASMVHCQFMEYNILVLAANWYSVKFWTSYHIYIMALSISTFKNYKYYNNYTK